MDTSGLRQKLLAAWVLLALIGAGWAFYKPIRALGPLASYGLIGSAVCAYLAHGFDRRGRREIADALFVSGALWLAACIGGPPLIGRMYLEQSLHHYRDG